MLLTLLRAAGGPQVYAVIYPAALSAPTAAQVFAGQNVNGVSATWAGSNPAPSSSQTLDWLVLASGLSSGTSYRVAFVWYDGTWYSNVAVSASFTTTAGGSQYFRVNLGSLTVTGSIRKQTRTRESGSLTPSGILRKLTRTRELGSLAVSGIVRKLTRRRLLGSLTLSALLNAIKQGGSQTYYRAVGGTLALAGAVRKRSTRRLASTISGISGGLRKFTRAPKMTGSVTPSGTFSLRYVVRRSAAGVLTASGSIRKFTRRTFSATSVPAGVIRKRTARRLAGSVVGTAEIRRRVRRRLAGSITGSGVAIRRFSFKVIAAAVISVSGTLSRLYVPPGPPEPFSQRLTHLRRFIGRR